MALDPATSAFLAQMEAAGAPQLWDQTPQQAREGGALMTALYGPGPDMARVDNHTIDTTDDATFEIRVLSPSEQPSAVIVYYHGGGWVVGDIDGYDTLARQLASKTNSTVVLVNYRKAPESPFPAAVDDAWRALLWAADNLDRLATEGAPLVVAGDSAGGNLAAVVTRRARDNQNTPSISRQILVYPVTDVDFDTSSYLDPANQLMLGRQAMMWFWDHYLPESADRTHPDASPAQALSLEGLPPAIVLTAEFDPLRDEGERYVDLLRTAGVDVVHERFDGQMHGFFSFVNVLPGSAAALSFIADRLENHTKVATK